MKYVNRKNTKAILIVTLVVSILISGCGVEKDSDDRVMLIINENITEVTSDGQENLLDINNHLATYWQYDSNSNLLISSSWGNSVSIYDMENGTAADIGFPEIDGRNGDIEYEGQTMYAINAWYEDGDVRIYACNEGGTLTVFTFDSATEELADTADYDIESPYFVRETGNSIVYVNIKNELNIYDKTTGENILVASDIERLGTGFPLIVLNTDNSKVLFAKTEDDAHVLYEYDIPSGETREVCRCNNEECITGFTYALDCDKIYLRYGRKTDAIVGYVCQPNHTMVITTDGREYELYSSLTDGYDMNSTGIVVY